jgi:two-component system, response regulator
LEYSQPTVLLVDDDPNDEELAKIALETLSVPHTLIIKRDGAEVLEFLRALEGPSDSSWPQLILLDLKLPKVDGLEVLRVLRSEEKTQTLPIVIFTSSSELRDLERSYELGANAYIRKPVDFSDYRKTMEDMGRFWLLRNNPPPRPKQAV